jgi:membrane protease YdiL (CAAX protease family)
LKNHLDVILNSLITIESYELSYQAQLARAELAAAGIPSWLADETLVSMDWFISNAVGGIKLQVSSEDADAAREILFAIKDKAKQREEMSKDVVVVFRCSSCKAVIAFSGSQIGRIENCPRCNRYVDVPETSDQSLDRELIQETLARFHDRENAGNENAIANSLYWSVEILFVLFIAYFRDLVFALQAYLSRNEFNPVEKFAVDEVTDYLWFRSIVVLLLLLPVQLLSKLPLSSVGLTFKLLGRDILFGLSLGASVYAITFAMEWVLTSWFDLQPYESSIVWTQPISVEMLFAYGLALLANSFAEEIVMRGYMIDRLERLFGKSWLAILIASLLFGSYHVYQGLLGAGSAVFIGMVFGTWFVWTRRLGALIVAHTICNLLHSLFQVF